MMTQFDMLMGEGRLQHPLQRRHGQHRRGHRPLLRGPAAGPARPVAHAQGHAALQRRGPRPLRRACSSRPTMGFLVPGAAVRAAQGVPLHADDAGRRPGRGPLPRRPDHRVPRRRALAEPLRAADRPVRQGRRRLRPRPQDQADPREARRADRDDVPQRDAAGRRAQVHQAGHPGPQRLRASRSTSIRSACTRPRRP